MAAKKMTYKGGGKATKGKPMKGMKKGMDYKKDAYKGGGKATRGKKK